MKAYIATYWIKIKYLLLYLLITYVSKRTEDIARAENVIPKESYG